MKLLAGQIVRFTYRFHTGAPPDEHTDDFKEVLILHPNWAGKMHGIDLKRLTAAEREVLDAIFDPAQRGKPHKLPLVNDVLRRMNPLEEVKNPMTFYSKFVKVFLQNKDAYRTYYPTRMLNPTIVENTSVSGKVINPKPLFHKVESKKPEPPKPAAPPAKPAEPQKAPPSRLELIKARAAQLKKPEPPK